MLPCFRALPRLSRRRKPSLADLCRTYRDGGGDPTVLEKAVTGEVDDDRTA